MELSTLQFIQTLGHPNIVEVKGVREGAPFRV